MPLDDYDLNTVRELARLRLDEHTHTHTQTEHIELEWASKPITEPLQVCKHVPTTIRCPVVIIWINKFKFKAGLLHMFGTRWGHVVCTGCLVG